LAQTFSALPGSLLSFVVIAVVAGPLAWIALVAAAAFVAASALLAPIVIRAAATCENADAARDAFIGETVAGLRTIRGHGAENIWCQRVRQVFAGVSLAGFRVCSLKALLDAVGWALMAGAMFAVLIWGTGRVTAGTMSIGTLVAGTFLTWRMLAPLQSILNNLFPLAAAGRGFARLKTLLRGASEPPPHQSCDQLRPLRGAITLRQVTLRCGATGEPILRGIDAIISAGERVVISGPSGSGKSSLVKLIAGLYPPHDGAVLIDGEDVRRLDYRFLRSSVAYVPQTAHVFEGTIAYNLRLSDPGGGSSRGRPRRMDRDTPGGVGNAPLPRRAGAGAAGYPATDQSRPCLPASVGPLSLRSTGRRSRPGGGNGVHQQDRLLAWCGDGRAGEPGSQAPGDG
jgi:ATP-binding cassette subfamily C protein/ATP-binding cassette subfamily C protein LapB